MGCGPASLLNRRGGRIGAAGPEMDEGRSALPVVSCLRDWYGGRRGTCDGMGGLIVDSRERDLPLLKAWGASSGGKGRVAVHLLAVNRLGGGGRPLSTLIG